MTCVWGALGSYASCVLRLYIIYIPVVLVVKGRRAWIRPHDGDSVCVIAGHVHGEFLIANFFDDAVRLCVWESSDGWLVAWDFLPYYGFSLALFQCKDTLC